MNISIITNFGCNKNCWYCIWRNHSLSQFDGIDYNKLSEFLCKYKSLGKVSLSGGGDPLYNYHNNSIFWDYIFNKVTELTMKLDIHTRIIMREDKFWKNNINRAVISFDDVTDRFIDDIGYLKNLTKVRLYHVVTKNSDIKQLLLLKNKGYDITLKQLNGFDDGGQYFKFKDSYNDCFYFLDNADYNIYFMPDNKEYYKFIGETR